MSDVVSLGNSPSIDTLKAAILALQQGGVGGGASTTYVDAGDAATLSAAEAYTDANAGGSPLILASSQAGTTYAPVLADAQTAIEFTNATGVTVTIPNNATEEFPVGTWFELVQMGTGAITVAASAGVTLDAPGDSLTSAGQFATITVRKRATDEWVVSGELAAPRVKNLIELQLSPLGLVSANYVPSVGQGNTSSPVSQSLYGMRIGLQAGMVITDIMFNILTAAAGVTNPAGAYVGIIDPTNEVVAQSANLAASAAWKSQGFQAFALSSEYVVPSDGGYAAFLLINGAWGTTQPIFLRNGGVVSDDVRFDFRQGGLTAPPANGASVTPVATATFHYWVGCVGS